METKKRLVMSFKTELGKKVSISVDEPREDISQGEIKNAMQVIVDKKVFSDNGDDLTACIDARVVETNTQEFDLA
ncbi:DUF2922 domain-containing protein [Romboutsia lituseburensis]|uniref:DUF2922 domain-containing protein n=1 Tax=Romboutsia lituseburensis TaxID=1537 RepID=UPI00215AFF22|nr:DUF2922 domain-containing protein [Romboutsia lituseburensis]MCR8747175.1 DUF2922 domain-containing protein [Romboutsia lituseburensis]